MPETTKKMSLLRRHRILQDDVRRVIAHLRTRNTITADDVLSRPRLKKKKGAGPTEEIPWAHAEVQGSWQGGHKNGPNGAAVLYAKESGVWKLVVPESEVQTYLRRSMLDPKSKMPLGRDSAYHHVQRETVGISRRALYRFLEKQGVLQVTKNIPNEQFKGGRMLKKRGYCEMDLIEGQGRDVRDTLGVMGDWYWLSLIEVLTGYALVVNVKAKKDKTKAAPEVAERLAEMLDVMQEKLGTRVTEIGSDHGGEFMGATAALLKRRRIKDRKVERGARIEKFNQDYQRNFYRIAKLGRGSGFRNTMQQALDMTNNTRNKHLRMTPEEALKRPDAELAELFEKGRKGAKSYKGKEPQVGDKCRYLIKLRKNIRPMLKIGPISRMYKTYHARHFSKQVYTIRKVMKPAADDAQKKFLPKYFVNGAWRHRDALLLVSGTDAETDRAIRGRARVNS